MPAKVLLLGMLNEVYVRTVCPLLHCLPPDKNSSIAGQNTMVGRPQESVTVSDSLDSVVPLPLVLLPEALVVVVAAAADATVVEGVTVGQRF